MAELRDMVILAGIILFWFFEGLILSYIYSDPLLYSGYFNGTYQGIPAITNYSSTGLDNPGSSQGFVETLARAFSFSLPTGFGMPDGVNVFITFLNWFLALFLGLTIYRMIRSGSG